MSATDALLSHTFGTRLRELRVQLALSQEAFGAGIGVTKATVSNWEADRDTPSFRTLQSLAATFAVSLDWLIAGTRQASSLICPTTAPPFESREDADAPTLVAIPPIAEATMAHLHVDRRWAQQHLSRSPNHLRYLLVMFSEPGTHLQCNDIALIDTACTAWVAPGLYVLDVAGHLTLRRLYMLTTGRVCAAASLAGTDDEHLPDNGVGLIRGRLAGVLLGRASGI